jgi:UDP-N-acetylglucosamine--N-acetylmuramyl-(pentapeptide) pyrophosphoryl-undecaprenol N-acetylglucosamine transferase
LLSRFCRFACCGFPDALERLRCPGLHTGNPVRESLRGGKAWSADRPELLVVGGSRGARALNEILPRVLIEAVRPEHGVTVRHQCGRGNRRQVEQAYRNAGFPVRVVEFIDEMGAAMNAARLIVCRAGASTISEIRQARLPTVLTPFPQATHDHQTFNALGLSRIGAAIVLPESELAEGAGAIAELLDNPDRLGKMSAAHPSAAADSAALCAAIVRALGDGKSSQQILEEFRGHVS